jgi:hypothetical protein
MVAEGIAAMLVLAILWWRTRAQPVV